MERVTQRTIKGVIAIFKGYQYWISPMLGNCCRFYPSCSQYAVTVIERFGMLKGGTMAVKRVVKCHPWHPGGEDFPPKE